MKTKAIYLLYRTLQALGLPLLLLYFAVRGMRDRRYFRRLSERLGFLPPTFRQTTHGAIWLHAVSVGEVLAASELIRRLEGELPRTPIFLSTTTVAGRATAEQKLSGVAAGLFYAPVDTVFAVRRVLRTLRPSLLVIVETEIWPNLFRETKRTGAGLLVVNGRISDRAAPRYRHRHWLFQHVLDCADAILTQSEQMRERYIAAGAPPECVRVGGNLKYDIVPRPAPPDAPVRLWVDTARAGPVWIAASTMPPQTEDDPDEDDAVLRAFRELAPRYPGLLLILAPRRPERFDLAAEKLRAAGIRFLRRSALAPQELLSLPGVLLLDTIGELGGLFPLADVVFMGGTLAHRGGHNILEPAFFARPVVIGPHMENFREIAGEFLTAGACVEIESAGHLASGVARVLDNRAWAAEVGTRARACAEARQGATARAAAEIHQTYARSVPRYRPAQPGFALLWLLSRLWHTGGKSRLKRLLARRRALDVPVVSVGNLTVGGTGKTPLVLYLAEHFSGAGLRTGILTRGYGRHSPESALALAPGVRVPVERTGDEPQIFLASGLAAVGIGRDRLQAGQLLLRNFPLDIAILDDGFQHVRLARQIDVVLIDALNPFGGGELMPLGRLREPLAALARADAFLITRSQFGRNLEGIEHVLRRHNPRAPIFRGQVRPQHWVEYGSGRTYPPEALPFTPVAAFCGIGNPESFWRTLQTLGIPAVTQTPFPDHHAYRPKELRRLSAQAQAADAHALVTTEKDFLNLCDDCIPLVAPLPLYWLKIRMGVEREAEFLELLRPQMQGMRG